MRSLARVASVRLRGSDGCGVDVEPPGSANLAAAQLLGVAVDRLEVDGQELRGLPCGEEPLVLVWSAVFQAMLKARCNELSQALEMFTL